MGRSGEIGIHEGFKIPCTKVRAGSSPASGTNSAIDLWPCPIEQIVSYLVCQDLVITAIVVAKFQITETTST